tara:strand:- start:9040 stop:9207 length:168 start_codon:yes stop_codon:yes gene_type:complete
MTTLEKINANELKKHAMMDLEIENLVLNNKIEGMVKIKLYSIVLNKSKMEQRCLA